MKYTVPLKENRVFRHLYGKGKSYFSPLFILYYKENKAGKNRMGITVNKKLGCAVRRNRAKRIIREAYRQSEHTVKEGYDLVFVARTKTVLSTSAEIRAVMDQAFRKTGLCR